MFTRFDSLRERLIVFSPRRAERPQKFPKNTETCAERDCPFCPGNEHDTPPSVMEIPQNGSWKIRVFPNKFPVISPDEGGYHEVVVETPTHDTNLEDLSPSHIKEVLEVFAMRLKFFYSHNGIKYVSLFKNHGRDAGASIPHSHSQIIALPFEPPHIEKLKEKQKAICPLCSMVHKELEERKRIVINGKSFTCLSYWAATFPFELWIIPKKHLSSLKDMGQEELYELAEVIKSSLLKLRKILGHFCYNLVFRDWWNNEECHFWLEILPRTTHIAGFELGSQAFINPMPPEEVAKLLDGRDSHGEAL